MTLVKGHSDFKVKCLTFGLYTQVSNSRPNAPLVLFLVCLYDVKGCLWYYPSVCVWSWASMSASVCVDFEVQFLARLWKTAEVLSQPWYRRHAKTLTFFNISVITEDIYLKLRLVVHYQTVGEVILKLFLT